MSPTAITKWRATSGARTLLADLLAGRAGCWRARRLAVADDHVAWLCWRVASDSPAPDRQENIDRRLTATSTGALTLGA